MYKYILVLCIPSIAFLIIINHRSQMWKQKELGVDDFKPIVQIHFPVSLPNVLESTEMLKLLVHVHFFWDQTCPHVRFEIRQLIPYFVQSQIEETSNLKKKWEKRKKGAGYGGSIIYYVTVCKRTPLEEFAPGTSRGFLLHTVLDEGT